MLGVVNSYFAIPHHLAVNQQIFVLFLFAEASFITHISLVWHELLCCRVVNIYVMGLCVQRWWAPGRVFTRLYPTGSLSILYFEDNWLNKPSIFFHSVMLPSTCLSPHSHPLPLSKHPLPASLWLIYRRCHPGEQRPLTSHSSSVAKEPLKFALISTAAAESCRGGGWCWCWCWVGGWLCECKCDQYENGL